MIDLISIIKNIKINLFINEYHFNKVTTKCNRYIIQKLTLKQIKIS